MEEEQERKEWLASLEPEHAPEQEEEGEDEKSEDEYGEERADISTNIESKREQHITEMLKKEDLGLILMRLRENVKVL